MAGATQSFLRENTNTSTNALPGESKGFLFAFVADDATGAFTSLTTTQAFDGALAAVGAKFGTTGPNSMLITVTDVVGIPIVSGTITTSGYIQLDRPMFFVPGPLTISITGNTTNSAAATVALVFA